MKLSQRIISAAITASMLLTMTVNPLVSAAADSTAGKGKYVQDVYIAYGASEEEAANNLPKDYEAVKGDFNAGRNNGVSVVMGILRSDDPENAITDMRLMNMSGSFSVSDYEALLGENCEEIEQFINNFMPTIKEFRENYKNGKGMGKKRAELAKKILDKFYDGSPTDSNAKNDTGMPIGDLLLGDLSTEVDGYSNMAHNEKAEHGDFVQIIMEGNGSSTTTIKQALAIAADTSDTTWLERVTTDYSKLVGDDANTMQSVLEQQLLEKYEDNTAALQS